MTKTTFRPVSETTRTGVTVRIRPGCGGHLSPGGLAELLEVRGSSALVKVGHDEEAWLPASSLEVVASPDEDAGSQIRELAKHYTVEAHNSAVLACVELCTRTAAMTECPQAYRECCNMLAENMRRLMIDGSEVGS